MMELIWQRDMVYDPACPEACRMEICTPEGVNRPPLFLYFHGGGLEGGSYSIGPNLQYLAREHGIAVASAEYRMYPSARFPDFVQDAARAAAYLLNELRAREKYSAVYVGGSSAGGYLSMMLCFAQDYLRRAGADASLIDGYVLDAGQPTTHYNILRERGLDPRLVRVDEAAPLWYITESFKDKPAVPLLILAADNDMPGRMEQNRVLHSTLLHFDYPPEKITFRLMEGFGHCAYNSARDEAGRYIFADIIAAFIRSHG